jgi:tRNA(Ser,Leu) C12 N-acetylase TAN1
MEGIEDICAKEVKGKKILPGRVKFDGKVKYFKSVNSVYKLIKKFKFKKKEEIITKIKKYPIVGKFKVQCERQGKHDFNSFELQAYLGAQIHKLGYDYDLKKPETIVFVDIINNDCLIGILIRSNLQKRDYRFKLSADNLNPCLAYTLLSLVKCNKKSIIVDPYCRDGVICIEAARLGAKVFGFYQNSRNARINAKIAKAEIDLSNKDLDWLDTNFDKKSVTLVSYIPSHSKNKPFDEADKFVKELFHQAEYVVNKYLAVISQKNDLILTYCKNFKLEDKREISLGETKYYIFIFKR